MNILHGNCLNEMRKMESNSIAAIVTDPPYGLEFMGKDWDHRIPGIPFWKEALRICKPGSHLLAFGGTRTFHRLTCAIEDSGWEIRDCLMWLYASGFPKSHNHFGIEEYGTTLKPAWEPIIMAMKPCDGTYKQNADKWGQAGINVDGSRIVSYYSKEEGERRHNPHGRWPANLILDEVAAEMLDQQSGILTSGKVAKHYLNSGKDKGIYGKIKGGVQFETYGDSGGASRFYYCAKASPKERGEGNSHPTVKPLKLMEYLIKLVMPPNEGVLLDPFAGSGTTILAAQNLGLKVIGIEKEAEYCEIAKARIHAFKPYFRPGGNRTIN